MAKLIRIQIIMGKTKYGVTISVNFFYQSKTTTLKKAPRLKNINRCLLEEYPILNWRVPPLEAHEVQVTSPI